MKQNSMPGTVAAGIILLTCLSGCVSVTRYSYKDAPKSDVQFESAAAAATFYDALLAKKFPAHGPPNGYVTVNLPLAYSQHHYTRPSANVLFNDAATKADANHDGIISESEARDYALAKQP